MWISKRFKTRNLPETQTGVLTLSTGEKTEAASSFNSRDLKSFAPYGYSFCAPVGEEVLLVGTAAGMSCAGTQMKSADLQSGEVSLSSLGNAEILLKNDGSVQINGVTFTADGKIYSESGGVIYGGSD